MKSLSIVVLPTLAMLTGGTALAQSNAADVPAVHRGRSDSSLGNVPVAPTGLALQLGGGVTAFSRQAARDQFGVGGFWDARLVLGTRSFIGAEVAYVGSARDIKASGVSSDAALVGNGAEAVVRGNLPLAAGSTIITPYLFGGAGWTYYQVARNDQTNTSGIKDHANALTIPFGAGASISYAHFLADARFTYRAIVDDKLVPMGSDDHLDLQNWSAGATAGYLF